jgi:ElaB/YqjD/DUF883 family membrane-anchored ribosome-binding protein
MRNGTLDVQKQIDTLQKDMSNIVHTAGALVAHKASDAKALVVDSGAGALEAITKVIKARPILAVGVAFGLGYLAMRFVHRRAAQA